MLQAADLAALLCAMAITLVVGAVILLRPVARRLPALLELMIEQRRRPAGGEPSEEGWKPVSALEACLDLLEERHGFSEAMSASGRQADSSGMARVHGRRSFGG